MIHDASVAFRTGGVSVVLDPKAEELSVGVGSALQPAESFNAFAHRVIQKQGAKALGTRVAQLVYERGFETTTSVSVQDVVGGRGYVQLEYYSKCAEFAASIVPPLTDEQRQEFTAGVRVFGKEH